jgi:hypothetical protein
MLLMSESVFYISTAACSGRGRTSSRPSDDEDGWTAPDEARYESDDEQQG